MIDINVEVMHNYKEGNLVAGFFSNIDFHFEGKHKDNFKS